jgi:hypothetical protein
MSVPTQVLSNLVPFMISADGGVTYKNVVCKKLWDYTGTAELIQEPTDCDVLTAVGAIKNSFNFEFVLNTTPNGASEWGSNSVMGWFQNKTLITVKVSNGTTFIRSIAGYISTYNETAAQGGMVTGKGTFSGSGSLSTS